MRKATLGIFAALAATSLLDSSAYGQSSISASSASQDGAGVSTVALDNPVLTASVTLATNEGAERLENAWVTYAFEFQLKHQCDANANFCSAVSGREDDAMEVWPTLDGEWSGGDILPLEYHGLSLGSGTSTITINKYDTSSSLSAVATGSVTLDANTILLPVNVVVVVPSSDVSESLSEFALNYVDPALYQALFDDQWTTERARASHGGVIDLMSGEFVTKSREISGASTPVVKRGVDLYDTIMNPDDVFAQCGIQFRLSSVSVIEETVRKNVLFMSDDNWTAICPDSLMLKGVHGSWRSAAADNVNTRVYGDFAENAITVVFSPYIANPDCVGGEALGLTNPSNHVVAIAMSHRTADAESLTLSHEIGHAVGLDHPAATGCSNNLMCPYGGQETSHLPGCELRDGVALDSVPYGCVPVAGETIPAVSTCTLARKTALSIVDGTVATASPFELEEPAGSSTTGWSSATQALSFNTSLFTEGTSSLVVPSGSWLPVYSPKFATADLAQVGSELSLDVFVGAEQPNPYWLGSIDGFLSVPAAGVYNAYLGHVELTGLMGSAWNTVSFSVIDELQTVLLGDFPGAQLTFAVNTPSGASSILLDKLVFSGTLTDRVIEHEAVVAGGTTSPVLSFDDVADWTVSNGSLSAAAQFTEGTGAITLNGSGWVEIQSVAFSASELSSVSSSLSVDLFVPADPPNPYCLGALQLYVSCPTANIYNAYIGQADLSGTFPAEYNTLFFSLPADVVTALNASANECSVKLALNVSEGSGGYMLDNLAFRP